MANSSILHVLKVITAFKDALSIKQSATKGHRECDCMKYQHHLSCCYGSSLFLGSHFLLQVWKSIYLLKQHRFFSLILSSCALRESAQKGFDPLICDHRRDEQCSDTFCWAVSSDVRNQQRNPVSRRSTWTVTKYNKKTSSFTCSKRRRSPTLTWLDIRYKLDCSSGLLLIQAGLTHRHRPRRKKNKTKNSLTFLNLAPPSDCINMCHQPNLYSAVFCFTLLVGRL